MADNNPYAQAQRAYLMASGAPLSEVLQANQQATEQPQQSDTRALLHTFANSAGNAVGNYAANKAGDFIAEKGGNLKDYLNSPEFRGKARAGLISAKNTASDVGEAIQRKGNSFADSVNDAYNSAAKTMRGVGNKIKNKFRSTPKAPVNASKDIEAGADNRLSNASRNSIGSRISSASDPRLSNSSINEAEAVARPRADSINDPTSFHYGMSEAQRQDAIYSEGYKVPPVPKYGLNDPNSIYYAGNHSAEDYGSDGGLGNTPKLLTSLKKKPQVANIDDEVLPPRRTKNISKADLSNKSILQRYHDPESFHSDLSGTDKFDAVYADRSVNYGPDEKLTSFQHSSPDKHDMDYFNSVVPKGPSPSINSFRNSESAAPESVSTVLKPRSSALRNVGEADSDGLAVGEELLARGGQVKSKSLKFVKKEQTFSNRFHNNNCGEVPDHGFNPFK